MQHVVGRGLVGRLSARFREGAVNGILTSRIGLATVEVCRPVPQKVSAKEKLGSLWCELVTLTDVGGKNGKLN
jgi:putative membrane protein